MGKFKPLLPFGNLSVVETCVQTLIDSGVDEIVVVVSYRADEVKERLQNYDVRFAFNQKQKSEMSESIACGIRELSNETDAVFITLVDQPAVQSKTIVQLKQARDITKKCLILPTFQNRGGHPVLIDSSLKNELLNLNSQKGLRSLFEKHPEEVLRVEVDSEFIRTDIDTWEDYRNLYLKIFNQEPLIYD